MTFNYQCVLFDLDGTLVDSRADIVNSVQLTLTELELKPLEAAQVLQYVGEGVRILVERSLQAALQGSPDDEAVDNAIEILQKHYRLHLLDSTRPYPGVEATLQSLAAIPKAVVTNKPFDFSVRLLQGLGLADHFVSIIGGDTLDVRKPSPEPLLEAARRCRRAPEDCLMVGDSRLDIEAGREAGITTCGFTSGFRGRQELEQAGATLMIDHFSELQEIVLGKNAGKGSK